MILVAVIVPLLLAVLGVTIDTGRYYLVQAKAQSAADAALLGAVATKSTISVSTEMTKLFNANYPTGYMGSTVSSVTVTNPSSGKYDTTIAISVPTIVMGIFGTSSGNITVTSQVTVGYQNTSAQSLELALVLDNSGNSTMNASKIAALQAAIPGLVNIIFGGSADLPNVHVSVVPLILLSTLPIVVIAGYK